MEFCMVVGLPASGKTTFAHQYEETHTIIDSDSVRILLFGDVNEQGQNAKVFDYMYKLTCENLVREESVFYVATNISSRHRINLLHSLQRKFPGAEYHCYIMNTPIEECYRRNDERWRHVPISVIDRMARQFQIPVENEGWDKITVINSLKPNFILDKIADKVANFGDQKNHNHTLSLANHCAQTAELANRYGYDSDIIDACYFHDWGKIYTQIYWEKDNYKEAHYPNHAEIGSYIALNIGCSLHVAQLIGYHMVPYTDEVTQLTWRIRLGEKLWEEIQKMHICDKEAH